MEKGREIWGKRGTTFSILASSLLYFVLGLVLFSAPVSFQQVASLLMAGFLVVDTLLTLIQVLCSLPKGWRSFWASAVHGVATVLFAGWILSHISLVWELLPLLLALFSALLGLSSLVSFLQYRRERTAGPLRWLFSAVIGLGFSIALFGNLQGNVGTALKVAGVYLILYGATLFEDFLAALLPQSKKDKLKRRVRIPLPVFLAAFLPVKMLQRINQSLSTTPEEDLPLTQIRRENLQPNVEVFVHVAPKGFGTVGHVDLCVEGCCISYGGYNEQAMKFGGAMGPGIVFLHHRREDYIRFCQAHSQKTLFSFGLMFDEEELSKLRDKLQEILLNAEPWYPDAQLVEEGKLPQQPCEDYGSKLYLATGAKFYRFLQGRFRHYWVLGTNCVRFADTLLYASGTDTLATGIISPGTYYEFLNREFERPNGRVIRRAIYPCRQSSS